MNTHELNDMRYLKMLIDYHSKEIEHLEQLKAHSNTIRPRPVRYVAAINELLKLMKEIQERDIAKYEERQKFINEIPDPELQEMFILRYQHGMTFLKLDDKFLYAEGGVKKKIQRYIEKCGVNDG